jgi:hypothetical protein
LIDRSGLNNHGTLTNMAGQDNWRANGSGVALRTDGLDDAVSVAASIMPLGAAPRTLACWINKPNNTTYGVMIDAGATSAMNRCMFLVIGAGGFSGLSNQTVAVEFNTVTAGTSTTIALNQWVHLAAVVQGTMGATQIYINGSPAVMNLRGTQSNAVNTTFFNSIGVFGKVATASYGEALYDDARIYNRVLTLAEIRLLASRRGIGLSPLPDRAAGLPRKLFVNVGGTWRDGDAYVNTGSEWRLGIPSVNAGGTWK